jgi:flagellar biosynthetic protein FliR
MAVGRDALLGAVVGYTFGLFLLPARVAGDFLAQEIGFSFGNQVSPVGEGAANPLTSVFEMLAAAIFFGLDGHHVFLGVMHGTFAQYPVGDGLPSIPLQSILTGASAAQEWGLMLAAPVALCLFLITVVLTLLARANPQLNLFSIGFPLRLGGGLVALLLLLPQTIATLVAIFGHFGELVSRIV